MALVQLQNYYLRTDSVGISGARLYLNPTAVVYPPPANPPTADATSGRWGSATLDVSALATGPHTLWVVPVASTNAAVGPTTGTGGAPNRVYRGLQVQLTIVRENDRSRITNAVVHPASSADGAVTLNIARQELTVRLRPIWIESPVHANRGHTLDMIVVHRTGGEQIGPAINQFLSGGTSCHYLIDRDGHIVKMVLDSQRGAQAGRETHWGSQNFINDVSVGIENVASTTQELTAVQYTALIRLIQDLMAAHSIPRHRVLGHSDIRTDAAGVLNNDRIACPGANFDWAQLEDANPGIGLRRTGGTSTTPDPVGAFFDAMDAAGVANLQLRENDHDPRQVGNKTQPGRFGGQTRPGVAATPIAQLQTWLAEIGYSVGPANGVFNHRTARAVLHFETHFLGAAADQRVDRATAALIRAVRLANPAAS
jgi:N-acetyl-anhydromuramyl-L-alanine amidase AmpD